MVASDSILERTARFQGELERVHAPRVGEFQRDYLRPRRPVVLTGLMDDWPAMRRWTFAFFKESYGDVEVPLKSTFLAEKRATIGSYVDDAFGDTPPPLGRTGFPLYLEGWYFLFEQDELARDYAAPACMGPDWIRRFFGKSLAPYCATISIGPRGGYTKLHVDAHSTPGWLAQIVGRKRWVLVPPADLSAVMRSRAERAGGYPGVEHPSFEGHPSVARARYWTAEIGPGDVIFVPADWYHQVSILEDSISVTHNFFAAREAPKVMYEILRTFVLGRLRRKRNGEREALPPKDPGGGR